MIKRCLVCGAEFKCAPSDKTVTCSRECKCKRRSELLRGKKQTEEAKAKKSAIAIQRGNFDNLRGGTAAAMQSPKAGRYTTNSSAKHWTLVSPDGQQYKCVNLKEFIRKNGALFEINGEDDASVDRIATGFIVLKRGLKNGTRSTCNRGWSIRLGYDDKKNCERK